MTVRITVDVYRRRLDAARLRAQVEEADRWYAEELERLRERAPA